MTPAQIRRRIRNETIQARVLADGCRDYVIEIKTPSETSLLCDWRGRTQFFRNLGDVHQILNACHVADVVMRQRVAHDEACHGAALSNSGFAEMRLHYAAG
jgi:hypothetical protein